MKDLYKSTFNRNTSLLNKGFDYKGKILSKTLSRRMFENPNIANFLSFVENIVTHNVESIKNIKKLFAYSISKHNNNLS
jgi:hypothetical protein